MVVVVPGLRPLDRIAQLGSLRRIDRLRALNHIHPLFILSVGSFVSIVGALSGLSLWSALSWRSRRSIARSGAKV